MIELREYTHEDYIHDLQNELIGGLYYAVKKRCDKIHEECQNVNMSYLQIGHVNEQLTEILDLIRQAE